MLHYDLPCEHATIGRVGISLGTTRLGVSRNYHAVPLFCGPLAEREWTEFTEQPWDAFLQRPHDPAITLVGEDRNALDYLEAGFGSLRALQSEAWWFLSQPVVQQQIDRVATALLERKRLSIDEVREIAQFTGRLCSPDWLEP